MGPFTIYNDTNRGATLVPNRFIDEYMKNANDAQIKVYLYLIRQIGANMSVCVEDIADQFNHTEKDVIRALHYWEKFNLLSIDYDSSGDITGIHLQDPDAPAKERVNPEPVKPVSVTPEPVVLETERKNNITKEQLHTLQADENFQGILFIAEQYIGKMLTGSQIKTFAYMYDTLHMSFDLIDFLIEYCVERGKTSHSYMEKVANNWADEGITTVEAAKETTSGYDADIYLIAKQLGNFNAPTKAEASIISKWLYTYAFSKEIISNACERAVFATNTNRIRYADKILTGWHNAGVKSPADIAVLDEAHASKPVKSKPAAKSQKPNSFNEFEQRTYDYDSLEKQLLNK